LTTECDRVALSLVVCRYKDELLASCLQLVLSMPTEFVDVALLVPALRTAFRMGLRSVDRMLVRSVVRECID
jgi:hypothetical protein